MYSPFCPKTPLASSFFSLRRARPPPALVAICSKPRPPGFPWFSMLVHGPYYVASKWTVSFPSIFLFVYLAGVFSKVSFKVLGVMFFSTLFSLFPSVISFGLPTAWA